MMKTAEPLVSNTRAVPTGMYSTFKVVLPVSSTTPVHRLLPTTCDTWGKSLSTTGSIGDENPFRYRGYYYDIETGFYYLNSRYCDPSVGRFMNADAIMGQLCRNQQ
jgi:RHS repeat-associated protein